MGKVEGLCSVLFPVQGLVRLESCGLSLLGSLIEEGTCDALWLNR